MCGIAGGMSRNGQPPSDSVLGAMRDALRHRGPDGNGIFKESNTGLVHTRLAIIDPNGPNQPFVTKNGNALVGNGEIYNDFAIRAYLTNARFQSGNDNESVLHLYNLKGLEFTNHLRGMYAVAIYDRSNECLVLARDPFGIKPLYYIQTEDAFWFASEPQALLAAGVVARQENADARDQLLGLQFTCGSESVFSSIERLAPGSVIVVKGGQIAERLKSDTISQLLRPNQTSNVDFDQLWMAAVDVHRRSDMPYGIFLSSGTDSTALLTAMARLERLPLVTFTAGFQGGSVHDERHQAAALAKVVGAEHRTLEIRSSDFWNCLPDLVKALDDPVADYAAVPTFILGKAAAQSVKVVLTGEGGDEIFAGYGRYRRSQAIWPFGRRPWVRHILQRSGVLRSNPLNWRRHLSATEGELEKLSLSGLQRAQALDILHWLPNDLLTKVDRCLMVHGVEGRVPFLDQPLAQYGFNLPDKEKIERRLGKVVVRHWLDRYRPESKPFAPKKGFSVPVGHWIAEKGASLGPLVAQQAGVSACCRPGDVEALFKNNTAKAALSVWILLFYALWHQCHIKGVDMSGSVSEILSEA